MTTYAMISDVDRYAGENAYNEWADADENRKRQCVAEATRDIVARIDCYDEEDPETPPFLGNQMLTTICILRALVINRTIEQRRHAERSQVMSGGSHSAGGISVQTHDPIVWDSTSESMLRAWMRKNGISSQRTLERS